MYVVSAQQMRDIDRFTFSQIGIPGLVLMENAGAAVVKEIEDRWPSGRVVILAGPGNNGGDGLVIARLLLNRGRQVQVWLVGEERKLSQDCRTQLQILQACGFNVSAVHEERLDALSADLQSAQVTVDAMLGTGAKGSLREPYAFIGKEVSRCDGCVIAVDMPTGVDSDTGVADTHAIKADLTVTFAYPKWGQFMYPGAYHVGELVIADISIPAKAGQQLLLKDKLITGPMVKASLPARPRFSHKGTYGHALIVAGSAQMTGAPVLSAAAGLRSGCGLLTMAVPETILPVVSAKINEPVFSAWPAEQGYFAKDSAKQLNADAYDAIAVGPGIGQWIGGSEWIEDIISSSSVPLILDADALNLLSENPAALQRKKGPIILTPHPGEMSRLYGTTVKEIENNRIHFARSFAQKHGVILVLKGAFTIIAAPDGSTYLNPTGSAALAKGGSGDVLTGIIAGMIAQMDNVEAAVKLAVYIHGLAGMICGERSMFATLAGDVIEAIGPAIEVVKAGKMPHTYFPGN
ncbi:NAD(P)H-hydrate dehydratase [Aneurinibacillus sp. Ricciae_BoGa-3]|uniref:NAD(P)H-hydrate dehydratase n=1 Tax=Aneurinibacillus sp. Ricciae_BoGa-3 TaxID=3022697 RepID=UPI002341CC68|nr:NAD(P)H-hydrate dehydratase [Aneurinibacillus sp. Ricciae_BoGa-3]WCK54987.1 NAD(P)H-hydrate dehydratase [Aneurinibacillus sp. Ricciae_BoGa-3]